ncbi:hypothetical protein LEN26_020833 [Aphanomyces euteiches]|nr:hypothetical protein LEN26_020833 [Aphanomyces euteiches]KAH9112920.1 hypothetical protein AeMF1_012805 [Aphanomyces euteiches]KAH9192711.1 hypothetical protein AeNC1_005323 [Aphanomyces euteiches]
MAMLLFSLVPSLPRHESAKAADMYLAMSEVAERLANARKTLKKVKAQIDWEDKAKHAFWKRQRAPFSAIASIKLHVEAALHERVINVLSNAAPLTWRVILRRDAIYRTLAYQSKWLANILAHAKKQRGTTVAFRRRSADDTTPLPQPRSRAFLDDTLVSSACSHDNRWNELLQCTPAEALSASDALPSVLYLAFELFLVDSHFDKTDMGRRLHRFCCEAISGSTTAALPSVESLVAQLCDHLAAEFGGKASNPTLQTLVRQMLHVRLAAAYVRPSVADLAAAASRLQNSKAKMRQVAFEGLTEAGYNQPDMCLERSVAAMEAMPTFMPHAIAAAYMKAVASIHEEVGDALGLASSRLSADVILPVLVAIVSRATLPHLALQAHWLESVAEGELAYYVALLLSALGSCL